MGNKCCCSWSPFDFKKKLCVLVLGGPGCGRTTQCQKIAQYFKLAHISPEVEIRQIMQLEERREPKAKLRRLSNKRNRTYHAIRLHERMSVKEREFLGLNEATPGDHLMSLHVQSDTEEDEMERPKLVTKLRSALGTGRNIDPLIITQLLKIRMKHLVCACNGYVVDGYPRDIKQAKLFVEKLGQPDVIIFLVCPDDVLAERLLKRAKEHRRFDDNQEMISLKLNTWRERSKALLEYWSKSVVMVDGNRDPKEVTKECIRLVHKKAGFRFKKLRKLHKAKQRQRGSYEKRDFEEMTLEEE